MTGLAACPNVAVKISGLGQRGIPWTVEANRAIVLQTIEIFGVDRCMFASNFPVDGLCATFESLIGGFREIVAGLADGDQAKLFHDNAIVVYAMSDLLAERAERTERAKRAGAG